MNAADHWRAELERAEARARYCADKLAEALAEPGCADCGAAPTVIDNDTDALCDACQADREFAAQDAALLAEERKADGP